MSASSASRSCEMPRALRNSRIRLPRSRSRTASDAIGNRKHDCVAREQTVCCRFMTRLDAFLKANELDHREVAALATMTRERLQGLRDGTIEPRLFDAQRLITACSYLLLYRVRFDELFEIS